MSSRNRRKQIQEEDNLLDSNPNSLDPKTADAIGFGLGALGLDIAAADAEYQAIEAVSIHNIIPNVIQPRYAIPHSLTDIYAVHPDNVIDIFKRWIEEVKLKRAQGEFDIMNYLLGENTPRGEQAEKVEDELTSISTNPATNIEKSLMKIVDLAASIRRDGLSNPISLVHHDGYYELETGERRWLAYHMLHWIFGENDLLSNNQQRNWSRIPSRNVREVDIWRQASENNARDNLNAISKARQLALLLMDLHGWDKFIPFNKFEAEQDFYSQVADGNQWRIPRGHGEQLLNAMGLSDASQLRQYRALLRLPSQDWRTGDDENLTEGELRKTQNQSHTVTGVTVSPEKSQSDPLMKLATDADQWRGKIRKQMNTTDQDTQQELKILVKDEIQQLQQLMKELDKLGK
jgi:hypothetical protein